MDKDLEIMADEHISFLKKYLAFILELDHYLGDRQCDVFILHECIKRNLWLLHFEECQKRNHNIRRNWIDFESEISLVTQMMELTLKQAKESSLTTNELEENFFSGQDLKQYPYFKVLGSEIMSYIRRSFSESVSVDVAKSSLIDKLYEDLTKFTTAIEIYLKICTKIAVEKTLEDIEAIGDIDKIVSFNYTDTFRKYLTNNANSIENICYVHGQIRDKISDNESPLVLGIDEYLGDEARDQDVEWAAFKKYFQRLYKHTDCSYLNWFTSSSFPPNQQPVSQLYIYGHLLDITDKDILRELILRDNQVTTIFYRNAEQLGKELKNMLKVIGHAELNKRMRSTKPTIFFKKQFGSESVQPPKQENDCSNQQMHENFLIGIFKILVHFIATILGHFPP